MDTTDPSQEIRDQLARDLASAQLAQQRVQQCLDVLNRRRKTHGVDPCDDPHCPVATSGEALAAAYAEVLKQYAEQEALYKTKLRIFDTWDSNPTLAMFGLNGVLQQERENKTRIDEALDALELISRRGIEGHA